MTANERRMIATVLFAARASVDAALLALDQDIDTENGNEEEVCAHPFDSRENLTEMGGPVEWRCRACGFHSVEGSTTNTSEG